MENEEAQRQKHENLHEPGNAIVKTNDAFFMNEQVLAQENSGDVNGEKAAAVQLGGDAVNQ